MNKLVKSLSATLFFLSLIGCFGQDEPIAIGFIGGLSGGNADLGESGRNGAIMAIEEVNQSGGIEGRSVKLVIKDDNNRPEKSRQAAQALVDADVEAIVGPLTSTTTLAAMEVANQSKMLMVSPTASAAHLAGRDDYLIRLCPTSKDNATSYADFLYEKLDYRSLSVVADLQNRVYSESWYTEFYLKWKALGGKVTYLEYVDTKTFTDYGLLTANLLSSDPDAVMFVANAVDVARLSQQVRKEDPNIPLIGSDWAATQNLITLGGAAVEGLVTMQIVNFFDTNPRFLDFIADYQERFGRFPSFASIISYDATRTVLQSLALQDDLSLKETMLTHQPFEGLQMPLVIDKWGDLKGKSTFVVVKDKEYSLHEG